MDTALLIVSWVVPPLLGGWFGYLLGRTTSPAQRPPAEPHWADQPQDHVRLVHDDEDDDSPRTWQPRR